MSIVAVKKSQNKRGRPPAGTEPITVRLTHEKIAEIDNWRREQPDLPNRPEAIRRLVDEALKG